MTPASGLVLVTGAGGYIGSRLVSDLADRGYATRTVHHRPADRADVVLNIGSDTQWGDVLDTVDTVVHLAARVHVLHETELDPLAVFRETNVEGTRVLAEAAVAAGVRRFVLVSTAGVLGAESDRPLDDADPPNPHTPYTQSKLEAEQVVRTFDGRMGIWTLRPPAVYGHWAPGNFARLLRLIRSGLPLPLGAARHPRSLISIDNLIDAVAACLAAPMHSEGTYLLSDGEDISVADLIVKCGELMEKRTVLIPVPRAVVIGLARVVGRSADVGKLFGGLRVDPSSFGRVLSWEPPFSLDEGLRRAVREPF